MKGWHEQVQVVKVPIACMFSSIPSFFAFMCTIPNQTAYKSILNYNLRVLQRPAFSTVHVQSRQIFTWRTMHLKSEFCGVKVAIYWRIFLDSPRVLQHEGMNLAKLQKNTIFTHLFTLGWGMTIFEAPQITCKCCMYHCGMLQNYYGLTNGNYRFAWIWANLSNCTGGLGRWYRWGGGWGTGATLSATMSLKWTLRIVRPFIARWCLHVRCLMHSIRGFWIRCLHLLKLNKTQCGTDQDCCCHESFLQKRR